MGFLLGDKDTIYLGGFPRIAKCFVFLHPFFKSTTLWNQRTNPQSVKMDSSVTQ